MSSSSSSKATTAVAITGAALVGSLLAYAAYFDYKRRNDLEFRKKLRAEKKQIEKKAQAHAEEAKLLATLSMSMRPEELSTTFNSCKEELANVPVDPETRYSYCMNLLSAADQMSKDVSTFKPAAIAYFKCLCLYANPLDLIGMYDQNLPKPVMEMVLELYNLEIYSRIQGYYNHFPPKSMNVSVSPNGKNEQTHILIAEKDFKAGDEIYEEEPLIAALTFAAHTSGLYCGYCFRKSERSSHTAFEPDALRSVFCSQKCNLRAKLQTENFLFGEGSALPLGVDDEPSHEAKADRREAQDAYIDLWKESGKAGVMIAARITALQVNAEIIKVVPNADALKDEFPRLCFVNDYSISDHMERLRYIDLDIPKGELRGLHHLLATTFPALIASHTDERHTVLRGKVAYNAIAVTGSDSDEKQHSPKVVEYARSAHPASKRVGSGLYIVSSYIHHSCDPSVRPEFRSGTNKLHLIANRDIKKGDELTMSYIDASDEDDESAKNCRKKALLDGWGITCICPKCRSPALAEEDAPEPEMKAAAKFEHSYTLRLESGLYSASS